MRQIRTKCFPALTCYAPGRPPRVFAQIENIPGNVTPEKLARAVARVTARKDSAEACFQKAASTDGETAADLYGAGFDLLAPMMGIFHQGELKKGKTAWTKEWEALRELDADDRFGWVRHFNFDDYRCIDLLGKCVRDGDSKLISRLLSIPQKHFSPSQKQFMKVLEYAKDSDGTGSKLSPYGKGLLKEAFNLGRDTFWGQFAMGRLMMDKEKIESKGLYRVPVRPRPSKSASVVVHSPFPLDRTKARLRSIKPVQELGESQKLDVARGAVLRLIGKEGWDELNARPGARPFVTAFMNDRTWLEDFAWSGTFASGKADPGDGAKAVLALESLIYQDAGKWVPFANGRFVDNEGRRFMTALALVYPDKDEAWLADVLDAYRTTALAGGEPRAHILRYGQHGSAAAASRQVCQPPVQGVWRNVLDDPIPTQEQFRRFGTRSSLLQAVGDGGRMAETQVYADCRRRVRRALEVRKRHRERARASLDDGGPARALRLYAEAAEREVGGQLQRDGTLPDAHVLLEQAPVAVRRVDREDVRRRPGDAAFVRAADHARRLCGGGQGGAVGH